MKRPPIGRRFSLDWAPPVEVNENQPESLLSLEVIDADGDLLSFSLEGVMHRPSRVPDSGRYLLCERARFEAQAVYEITIVVSDGTEQTRQKLSVRIVDVAEAQTQAPVEFNLVVARGTNGFGTGNKYSINDNISPDLNLRPARLTACSSQTEVMERIRLFFDHVQWHAWWWH